MTHSPALLLVLAATCHLSGTARLHAQFGFPPHIEVRYSVTLLYDSQAAVQATPTSINNHGVVLGHADGHAFLYDRTGFTDLDARFNLPSSVIPMFGGNISDNGNFTFFRQRGGHDVYSYREGAGLTFFSGLRETSADEYFPSQRATVNSAGYVLANKPVGSSAIVHPVI
jgi:hypothetical protein